VQIAVSEGSPRVSQRWALEHQVVLMYVISRLHHGCM
jgi:hypothetical protein